MEVVALVVLVLDAVDSGEVLVPVAVGLDFELLCVVSEPFFLETNLLSIIHVQKYFSQYFGLLEPVDFFWITYLGKKILLFLFIHIMQQLIKQIQLGILLLVLVDMDIGIDFLQRVHIPDLQLAIHEKVIIL